MTDQAPPAAAPEQPQERPGYRGRCLYKTGKCMNERALKTSGAAHNLCEEHRNRQNQHQRKLDAKNRVSRKDKRGGKQPGDAPRASAARFAPYPTAAAAVGGKKRSASLDAGEMVALAPATPPPTGSSAQQQPLPPSVAGLHGLALAPVHHAAMAHASGDAAAAGAAAAAAAAAVTAAANSAGMVYLPNGPQPPQLAYPFAMQDFDGIVVPLPSYLEGQERIEFRARIYQKVLDFISEECILRFSGGGGARVPFDSTTNSNQSATAGSSSANAAHRDAGGATRSISSSSSSSSSSAATEASAASPALVIAAQQPTEDPVDTNASVSTPSSRRPSPSAANSNDKEHGTAAAATDASSVGPGTPSSGAPTPMAAPKRSKRSARS